MPDPTEIIVSPGVIEVLAYLHPDAMIELTPRCAYLTLAGVTYAAAVRPVAAFR